MSGLDKRPRIKWECLKDEEKKREYKRRTNELIQEERKEDMNVEWTKLTKVMMQAAEEVCGVIENGVANPWTFGSEEEISEWKERESDTESRANEENEKSGRRNKERARESERRS